MKSIVEILKSKGITEKTKNHNYEYLFKTVIFCCEEFEKQFKKDNSTNKSDIIEKEELPLNS